MSFNSIHKLLVLLAAVAVCSAIPLFAETEVSGEVSGVWDREGSPYIVVDSTWVPENDSLTLTSGAEVQFQEDQGLYIYGIFTTLGERGFEDSVRVRVADDVEQWRGLRFYGDNRALFNYTWIVCPDTAILLDVNYELEMNNCEIEADFRAIGGYTWNNQRGWNLIFSDSKIAGGMYLMIRGGTVTAENTWFNFRHGDHSNNPGFCGEENAYTLINCYVVGGLQAVRYVYLEDCLFSDVSRDLDWWVTINGNNSVMRGTIVDSDVAVAASRNGRIILEDNLVTGELTMASCDASVIDCDIRGEIRIDAGNIDFHNCFMSSLIYADDFESLSMDSCFLTHKQIAPNDLYFDSQGDLNIRRSVIKCRTLRLRGGTNALLDHNTILFDSEGDASIDGNVDNSVFSNNIILPVNNMARLFWGYCLAEFEYNCICGYNAFSRPGDSLIVELPDFNINEDPKINWFGVCPLLSNDSPCIDSGDPNTSLDPDNTRSDIGACAFYQVQAAPEYSYLKRISNSINAEVFPNPFNNNINISYSCKNNLPVSISMIDITGRIVRGFNDINSVSVPGFMNVNTTTVPSGKYYLYLRNECALRVISVICIK